MALSSKRMFPSGEDHARSPGRLSLFLSQPGDRWATDTERAAPSSQGPSSAPLPVLPGDLLSLGAACGVTSPPDSLLSPAVWGEEEIQSC